MSPNLGKIAGKSTPIPREDHLCRILAIDYGRKKMGLAVSDELGLTARPLMVFQRKNRQDDIRRLRQIARDHATTRIVVGFPIHMSGQVSAMALEAQRFARRLAKELGIEVELQDERLTSWEARQTAEKRVSGRADGAVDDIAAAILLREYLDLHREAVEPGRGIRG